jgi:hypothetical protein
MAGKPKTLGAIVGKEGELRKTVMRSLTERYHALDKPTALMEGMRGEYTPAAEGGLELVPEEQRVQSTVKEMIDATREQLAELFDVTAARDFTNSSGKAQADVVVGEVTLIKAAPVPYLLWLDKRLDDLRAFATRIPTLSASTEWTLEDSGRGVWKSKPVVTLRQTQQPKVVTVFQPTDKQPGQFVTIQEVVVEGKWTRVKFSGAMPVSEREQILSRITKLKNAVHAAKEEAKRIESPEQVIGEKVLNYIFG